MAASSSPPFFAPLSHLSAHLPALVASTVGFTALQLASPILSQALFGSKYAALDKRTKLNWDIRVVALAHALLVVGLSAPIFGFESLQKNRLFGYDYYAGNVYSVAVG
jgi:hypothetical protein